eukprot:UN07914
MFYYNIGIIHNIQYHNTHYKYIWGISQVHLGQVCCCGNYFMYEQTKF